MKTVFLHLHDEGKTNWVNKKIEFDRVPTEGEFFTLSHNGEWYKIELIIHTPFSSEMCAEVYAVQVHHQRELEKKLNLIRD